MFPEPILSMLRKLTTCVGIALACTLALPSSAGKLAAPGMAIAPVVITPSFAPTPAVKAAGGVVSVVEYYNAGLKHYFITADPGEITALDAGFGGGVWKRTGQEFPAWDLAGAPAGTVPVCRFFGTDKYRADGSRIGPNSHFYDAVPDECEFVKTAWQSIAADGISYPAWTFEKYAFAVKLRLSAQQGGLCPAGTQNLYRAYNNGLGGDPNHRYSTDNNLLGNMGGWATEGVQMCLPQANSAGLPAQLVACGSAECATGTTPVGSGTGLVSLLVNLTNGTASPQEVVIEPGQSFVAVLPVYQNGVLLERVQLSIAPGTTRVFLLRLYCTNLAREAAQSGALYTQGSITGNAGLLDIGSIAAGKLGSVNDPIGLKAGVVQYAVWEITNGRGSLTAQQRSMLVAMLATAADDVEALANMSLQFVDTLSYVPPM
jgi:hypothetical protein